MATRAVDTVSGDLYRKWFCELPAGVQNKMTEAWGPPPGDLFVHEDRLIIPGIINGNVFIGLQPPRGFLEDPAAIYHSPDHPIPHHYYAYYRWIRDVFGADLVMHIGKHGSLEWLPGKGAGLSSSCFPDIAIDDLPNIYPYIINNPGEGTQAKRRSYCCIIDHLVPVMHNADSYEEMAELEVLLQDYQHVVSEDPGKTQDVQRRIWGKVSEAKLDHDLLVNEVAAFSDFDSFLDRLHDYIHEMADTQIRDGLHIFGEPPEGSRLDEFLVALTRLSNGSVPSMREALAELLGHDYDELLRTRGQKGGHIIEEVHCLSLKLVERFHQENFSPDVIEALEDEGAGEKNEKIGAGPRLYRKIPRPEDKSDHR
jgi:cobaltochelatase CobN